MKRVCVLGGTGMLGAMVVDVLSREPSLKVSATSRSRTEIPAGLKGVEWRQLDAANATVAQAREATADASWIVNCIGITKPLIDDNDRAKIDNAIRVNAMFPHVLAAAAKDTGAKVLQIATDCVYSGAKGNYVEADAQDALDVYGKSKSLGEVKGDGFFNLRGSIIGPEPKDYKFLVEWFAGQPQGAKVNGFTNHLWNGVTTLHFARVTNAIVSQDLALPNLQHLIAARHITKAAMLHSFAASYNRHDVTIDQTEAASFIDRTLSTAAPDTNAKLWALAGYTSPPSVEQMIAELAAFDVRFGRRVKLAA